MIAGCIKGQAKNLGLAKNYVLAAYILLITDGLFDLTSH
jgi:hypothetical protein